MDFISALENTLNTSITENGARGYKTTGKSLVDMNFKTSSYRNCNETEIIEDFTKSYTEDAVHTLKWLFYLRDVRQGMGERRTFRIIFGHIVKENPDLALRFLHLISVYGRWDDVISLFGINYEFDSYIIGMIKNTLEEDLINSKNNKPISLLAKWMPSENTSSNHTKILAKNIRTRLSWTPKQYRQTLSKLRKYLDVVERKMSANEWNNIEYSKVPSKANILYSNAFMRHDTDRREQFLEQVKEGVQTINSSVNFPHDIVHKYNETGEFDETLEQLWKSLPDMVNGNSSTIVVADGSGSMIDRVGGTKVEALEIANSLAIYFSERCRGIYKNKYITFSHNPKFVDFSKCDTLYDKIKYCRKFNEISDTNIEKTFDLILQTAIENNLSQEDLPGNILIISDMEFNYCTTCVRTNFDRLFDVINSKFETNGYKMPRLIFWNVMSRTNTIPLKENENGVILVSGFSPNTLKMVMSGELDPYKALISVLDSPRYEPVELALNW